MDQETLSVEEANRHVKLYLGVFAALLVLTAITVTVAFVDLGHGTNIGVALLIATAKASLVGLFFMHLKWERKSLHGLLLLTFFFFAGMIGLTVGGYWDTPNGTVHDRTPVEIQAIHHQSERSE
ncbi:MAG: cytochrome C oxidase subunit IV family protein [Candidatus Omnitrophica bacterium]|nr:cytochrome C oxidase subunit IV family protein [Candidatus Omnitrophota bacterium]